MANPIDEFLQKVAPPTQPPGRAAWTRHQPYLAREVAESELAALAKRAQAADQSLSEAQAYAKALETERGKEIYARYIAAGQEVQSRVSKSTRESREAVWEQIVKAAEAASPGPRPRAAKVDAFLRTPAGTELYRQYAQAAK